MARRTTIPPDLIALSDAAKMLKMDDSSIRRWIDEGKIRGYRVGGTTIRVPLSDIENLVVLL
jgi:excisionase family DNA binding protein